MALFCVGLVPAGCNWGPKRPVVNLVEGRVTLDGEPVEGVGVLFHPLVHGQGVAASGITRADGSYLISSTLGGRMGAGAVAGEYAVMLRKQIQVAPEDVPPKFAPATGDPARRVQQWFSKQETEGIRDNQLVKAFVLGMLPDAYGDAEKSGLRVTVKPGTNKGPAFEFDLRRDFQGARPTAPDGDAAATAPAN